MRVTLSGVLLAGSVAMATAVAIGVFGNALGSQTRVAYDEIDVGRINVREEDGRIRLVISNKQRFPGLLFRGKEHPHPNRKTAGLLFFNEEQTENGGLIFDGRKIDGQPTSGGHLSFDRYEQDQVIQITHEEAGGQKGSVFAVNDYPEGSADPAAWEPLDAMPEGPAKAAEMKRLRELYGGKRRLQLGRRADGSTRLAVSDAAGRPRLVLEVAADGESAIRFMDESGKVVRTVTQTTDR
jgi:hypothetical protein